MILLSLASKGSIVYLSAYTYDRSDVTEQLLLAQACGAIVRVILDEKSINGATREMRPQAIRMLQSGVEVRSLCGKSCVEEYRATGRNVASHLRGIHHSKTLLVDEFLVVGSCNWTTSSRSNFETGTLLQLHKVGLEEIRAFCSERWSEAVPVTVEDLRREGRGPSAPR